MTRHFSRVKIASSLIHALRDLDQLVPVPREPLNSSGLTQAKDYSSPFIDNNEGANMAIEVNGNSIETDANGNLINHLDWNEDVAKALAAAEGIELTQAHWDVIHYLREEFVDNGGNQPMERVILKDMGKRWDKKLSSKDLYSLFPLAPSKQGNRIAGLPFVLRKGGY
jgi:TusE/DsrC/DsvC family sulfur relay protein